MSLYKSQNVSVNVQLTSALTHILQVIVTDKTATGGQILFTEVSGTGNSFIHDLAGGPIVYPIEFEEPGLRFNSGVSISIPTSAVVNVIFERGA